MPNPRSSRNLAFLHALGLYHIGEALDHVRSDEDDFHPQETPRSSASPLSRFITTLIQKIFRKHASGERDSIDPRT